MGGTIYLRRAWRINMGRHACNGLLCEFDSALRKRIARPARLDATTGLEPYSDRQSPATRLKPAHFNWLYKFEKLTAHFQMVNDFKVQRWSKLILRRHHLTR